MKKFLKICGVIIVSFLAFLFSIDEYTSSKNPPWHPFKIDSELTINSLVESGYRCESIPCGQPQFVLRKGDTLIQYDVSSVMTNYPIGFYPYDTTNAFFPFGKYCLEVYLQGLNWSIYKINFDKLDSLEIVNFIESNGGNIDQLSSWNTKEGGKILVYYPPSKQYFYCNLDQLKKYDTGTNENHWNLSIVRWAPE